jgi:hypothetical protein
MPAILIGNSIAIQFTLLMVDTLWTSMWGPNSWDVGALPRPFDQIGHDVLMTIMGVSGAAGGITAVAGIIMGRRR